MNLIAVKMLVGDRTKYAGIVLGIVFAVLLITQQTGLFFFFVESSYATVTSIALPDIWVMDPQVRFIDDRRPMSDTALQRVRGVEGVAWAVPLYKGGIRARISTGKTEDCVLIGIDDATLIGGPATMLQGRLEDLRRSGGVIIDQVTAEDKLARPGATPGAPKIPLRIGDSLELNDNLAIVVGICKNIPQGQGQAVVITTYTRALTFSPYERRLLSYVLVKARDGLSLDEVCANITRATGLAAYTAEGFKRITFTFILQNTPLALIFGFVVALGVVIGVAIAGQTFYSFTMTNLQYFAMLRAMGAGTFMLIRLVVLQALVAGGIGYGLGIGVSCLFGAMLASGGEIELRLTPQLLIASATAVLFICVGAALASIVKVLRLEPAVVFKA